MSKQNIRKPSTPPTRYVLRYVDNALYAKELARVDGFEDMVNPDNILCAQDAETVEHALAIQQLLEQSGLGTTFDLYERINIREVVHSQYYSGPPEWEWEEQHVDLPQEDEPVRSHNAALVMAYQLIQPQELGMSGFAERIINRPRWQEVVKLLRHGKDEEARKLSEE